MVDVDVKQNNDFLYFCDRRTTVFNWYLWIFKWIYFIYPSGAERML